jgi:hypothetical protein
VHVDTARRADLAGAAFEIRPEGIGYHPPAILDVPLHGCVQRASPPFSTAWPARSR